PLAHVPARRLEEDFVRCRKARIHKFYYKKSCQKQEQREEGSRFQPCRTHRIIPCDSLRVPLMAPDHRKSVIKAWLKICPLFSVLAGTMSWLNTMRGGKQTPPELEPRL